MDLKFTYKSSELKTLPPPQDHLRAPSLMSSYSIIKLALGLFFQKCVEFLHSIQNLNIKDMGFEGVDWVCFHLGLRLFKIIQNNFGFMQVRNVTFQTTVMYLQEKQRPHNTSF